MLYDWTYAYLYCLSAISQENKGVNSLFRDFCLEKCSFLGFYEDNTGVSKIYLYL